MDPVSPDSLAGGLASPPGPVAILDRSEGKLDPKETVVLFQPTSMVLRSHSRAGRSESTQSAENVHKRRGGVPRPELEIVQPEVEDVSCAGRALREDSDSPGIDSSGETVKTLSGPPETGNGNRTPSVLSPLVNHRVPGTTHIFHLNQDSSQVVLSGYTLSPRQRAVDTLHCYNGYVSFLRKKMKFDLLESQTP